jgi:hypothetical protein
MALDAGPPCEEAVSSACSLFLLPNERRESESRGTRPRGVVECCVDFSTLGVRIRPESRDMSERRGVPAGDATSSSGRTASWELRPLSFSERLLLPSLLVLVRGLIDLDRRSRIVRLPSTRFMGTKFM